MLPEDIQGQAGASEPEPLLLRPGEAGPGPHEAQLWLRLRAAAHCQDDPGPGLTPHSQPAADYCRCCAATVAVTTQPSAADQHDILTHCSPADASQIHHRQTTLLSFSGDGLGAGQIGKSVSFS